MSLQRPLPQFVLSLTIVLAVTMISVWLLAGSPQMWASSAANNIGTVLQGTLGIAASLAGALVAIRLASLANEIIQHEREREDFNFLNDKIEQAMRPIVEVALRLSELYGVSVSTWEERTRLMQASAQDPTDASAWELSIGKTVHFKQELADKFDALVVALEHVLINSVSLSIWRQAGKNETMYFQELGINKNGFDLNASKDLGEFLGILRLRTTHLREQATNAKWADIYAPRYISAGARTISGEEFNHASVRNFLELGSELWILETRNLGAALLADMAKCIPASHEELEEILLNLFGKVIDRDSLSRCPTLLVTKELGTHIWFSSSLSYTLEELRKLQVKL